MIALTSPASNTQANPVASIERKTAFGKESFELSIRNRIINQYYKEMAKLNWQLDSCKFSDVSACNPIMFTTENFWQDAASFVLRCYADKSLEGGRTNKLMKMLNKLDRPQQVKVSHGLVKKHLRIFQQHRKNPKKAFTVSKQDNSAAKIKEDLILIYKDILAPVLIKEIKQANSYKRCEEVLFQEFI